MEEFITGIVNVTIFYPEGVPAFWEFLCGKTDRIIAKVEFIPRDTKLLEIISMIPISRTNSRTGSTISGRKKTS